MSTEIRDSDSESSQQIATPADQWLGRLLVESGKLKPTDVDRVLVMQKRHNMRFGEAAVALKILTQEDVQHALAGQFAYTYLYPGEGELSPELVAAYQPFSEASEALRSIRSQLTMGWFDDPNHRTLAVVGSSRGEGRSYLAANLAIVFSQLGRRTLLIDADLRRPRQHRIFNLSNTSGLGTLLAGHSENVPSIALDLFPNLSILVSGAVPPNPLELLGRQEFSQLLRDAGEVFDVIILDTPSSKYYSDAQVIAGQSGAAIIVTRKHQTRVQSTQKLISSLKSAGVEVVGIVANLSIERPLLDSRFGAFLINTFHFLGRMKNKRRSDIETSLSSSIVRTQIASRSKFSD